MRDTNDVRQVLGFQLGHIRVCERKHYDLDMVQLMLIPMIETSAGNCDFARMAKECSTKSNMCFLWWAGKWRAEGNNNVKQQRRQQYDGLFS